MLHYAVLFFLVVCGMGLLTWACLPFTSHKTIAVGAFVALSISALAASVESTGQPKPLMLEWRDVLDAQVVGLTWNEDQHIIWIWLMLDGAPHSYILPWPKDKQQFGQLQDRWRRRGVSGDEFRYDADGDVAKVVPPKPMPNKEAQ